MAVEASSPADDALERACFAYEIRLHELAGAEYVCKRDRSKHVEAMRAALSTLGILK